MEILSKIETMIKTIIFDLGGVILNRGLWLFREYLVREYGVTNEQTIDIFIKKYYKLYFSGKISEEDFWKGSLNDLRINSDWKTLKEILLNSYETNKEVIKILNELRKKKYKTVLLSDQTREWWSYLNKKYKISENFDYTILSFEVGVNKPNPEIYKIALERSSGHPEECVFIDDLESNLPPAEELGIKTILFRDVNQLNKDLRNLGINLE